MTVPAPVFDGGPHMASVVAAVALPSERHAHGAEAEGGDERALLAEPSLLDRHFLLEWKQASR